MNVPALSALALEQWIAEYRRLKKVNADKMNPAKVCPLTVESTTYLERLMPELVR